MSKPPAGKTGTGPKPGPVAAAPAPPAQAAGAASNSFDALRAELHQVTALLQETDDALDEWVAECERLQGVVATKDSEIKALMDAVNELRQEVLRREDLLKAAPQPPQGAGSALSAASRGASAAVQDTSALREQLVQAQTWVKEGLEKLKDAEARALAEKKRADALSTGKHVGEAARLGNVVHAHELELAKLRALVATLKQDCAEARAQVGVLQATSTVLSHELDQAKGDEAGLLAWLRGMLRWSSRM